MSGSEDNRPSMQKIADIVGVSKSAVSLALRNDPRISAATRERVQAAAEELGYQRNPVVDSLMTQLRSGSMPSFKANLGLINCTYSEDFSDNKTLSRLIEGVLDRAKYLGYGIENFWLKRSKETPERFQEILETRGIKGLILIVPLSQQTVDLSYSKVWNQFPCAILGNTLLSDRFSSATNDLYLTARRSTEKMISMGYQRPMLLISEGDDVILDNKYSAGFNSVTSRLLSASNRIDPVWYLEGDDEENLAAISKYKPDVILSNRLEVHQMLLDAKFSVPEEIGFYLIEWRLGNEGISGMRQNNFSVGGACADLVVEQVQKNEGGVQSHPKVVLIGSEAVEGNTVSVQ